MCTKALCQLSLKQKRIKFAVVEAGVQLMGDNNVDPLWQLQSCLLTCNRDTELFHALAPKAALSQASTQFFKDNSPQANAD